MIYVLGYNSVFIWVDFFLFLSLLRRLNVIVVKFFYIFLYLYLVVFRYIDVRFGYVICCG